MEKLDKLESCLKEQRSLNKKTVLESQSATKVSYKVADLLARNGKVFCDGDIVKECFNILMREICPEKLPMVSEISLSRQTITRRIEDISNDINKSLSEKIASCEYYSLAMDESTDNSSTAQLAIFIKTINDNFEIAEELLNVCHMKGTTTGKDVLKEVTTVMEK